MDKNILLQKADKIYKEIAEEEKRLCEDFLSISPETISLFFVIPAVIKHALEGSNRGRESRNQPLFGKEGRGEILDGIHRPEGG